MKGEKGVVGRNCDICRLFYCLGDVTVEVIEECSCKGSCYRMSYWESYFERTTDVTGHVKDVERVGMHVEWSLVAADNYTHIVVCVCD